MQHLEPFSSGIFEFLVKGKTMNTKLQLTCPLILMRMGGLDGVAMQKKRISSII